MIAFNAIIIKKVLREDYRVHSVRLYGVIVHVSYYGQVIMCALSH